MELVLIIMLFASGACVLASIVFDMELFGWAGIFLWVVWLIGVFAYTEYAGCKTRETKNSWAKQTISDKEHQLKIKELELQLRELKLEHRLTTMPEKN